MRTDESARLASNGESYPDGESVQVPTIGERGYVLQRVDAGFEVLYTRCVPIIDIDDGLDTSDPEHAGAIRQAAANLVKQLEIDRLGGIMECEAYRTRKGFRIIVTRVLTDGPVNAKSEWFAARCAVYGADPVYQRLCQQRDAYAVRLSCKPKRMAPESPDALLARHVCYLISSAGRADIDRYTMHVLRQHDKCVVDSSTPLA